MKRKIILVMYFSALASLGYSQKEKTDQSPFTVTMDLVNRYIWRGSDFGNAPQIQPTIKFTASGLTAGAWGSYSILGNYQEADMFASYSFPCGLSAGLTDYYFPSGSDDSTYMTSGHYLELNGGYSLANFSVAVNAMLATPAKTNDIYIELGYAVKNLTLFIGAGNESYTTDKKFMVCNTGIKVTRDIKITDTYTLPLFGAILLNPQKEQIHLVAGITF